MKNFTSNVGAAMLLAMVINLPTQAGFLDRLVDRVERGVENAVSGTVARKASNEAAEATEAAITPAPRQASSESSDQSTNTSESEYSNQSVQSTSTAPVQSQSQAPASQPSTPQAVPSAGGFGAMLQALQQKAEHKDQYTFDFEVETEMTTDGERNTVTQAYGADGFMVGLEENQRMVLDVSNQAMLMINDSERTVMAMSTQFMKQMASLGKSMIKGNSAKADEIRSIRKTGETKQVAGYLTHQWTYEGADGNGEIWVAESLDFDFVQFNKQLMSLFDDGSGQFSVDFSRIEGEFPVGLPLETIGYSSDGQVEHKSRAIRVSENPASLDLRSYKTQSMMGN